MNTRQLHELAQQLRVDSRAGASAPPPRPALGTPLRRCPLRPRGGGVITGDLTLRIADVELVRIELNALISSVGAQDGDMSSGDVSSGRNRLELEALRRLRHR